MLRFSKGKNKTSRGAEVIPEKNIFRDYKSLVKSLRAGYPLSGELVLRSNSNGNKDRVWLPGSNEMNLAFDEITHVTSLNFSHFNFSRSPKLAEMFYDILVRTKGLNKLVLKHCKFYDNSVVGKEKLARIENAVMKLSKGISLLSDLKTFEFRGEGFVTNLLQACTQAKVADIMIYNSWAFKDILWHVMFRNDSLVRLNVNYFHRFNSHNEHLEIMLLKALIVSTSIEQFTTEEEFSAEAIAKVFGTAITSAKWRFGIIHIRFESNSLHQILALRNGFSDANVICSVLGRELSFTKLTLSICERNTGSFVCFVSGNHYTNFFERFASLGFDPRDSMEHSLR